MFDIIKNAELPQIRRATPYPFNELNVGDGFDAPDDLGASPKGNSRRVVSIKNGIAKRRKEGGESCKYLTGPHPTDAGLIRCVRVR
jgi:hypothetical protein